MTLSPTSEIVVRQPANDGEVNAFFRLAAAQFMRNAPAAIAGEDFRRFVHDAPAIGPTAVRGAFRGDDYLGGYLIEDRLVRVGPARLRTGCIGVVVVDPAQRGRGIGKALMRDSLAYARSRGQVLTLLHGLADYYRAFGYADVFDATEHAIVRSAILESGESPYQLRLATVADVSALLALYDRHYGPHPGSFARSSAQQEFLVRFGESLTRHAYPLRDGSPFTPAVVAVDAGDRPRGYLVAPWGPLRAFGSEVAADDWPATLALLHHDARNAAENQAQGNEVRWPLPPDSLMAALLADHFAVERVSKSRPWANWEAALIDRLGLMRGMVPVWNERWLRSAAGWSGTLALKIDGVMGLVHLRPTGVSFAMDGPVDATIVLTGRVVMPLTFGFRSVTWAAQQDGELIPPELVPILEVLFPPITPWIAPTDGC